jgi:hypothetical protein
MTVEELMENTNRLSEAGDRNGNLNCLARRQCPQCGQNDEFRVVGEAWFEVSDDGAAGYEDVEWDEASLCQCLECGWIGLWCDLSEAHEKAE